MAAGRQITDTLNNVDVTGFNGANQLVQMTAAAKLPAVDASLLTNPKAIQPLFAVVSQPTCSGAGPDTLVDYDIPANTLNANGAQVRFRYFFLRDTVANIDLQVSIGGTLVASWDHNQANEIFEYTIVRTAASTQKVSAIGGAGSSFSTNRAELTKDDTATINILITGTSTGAAVGTLLFFVAEFVPAP